MQADTSKSTKSAIFCWHQNSRKFFCPKLNIWVLRDIRTKVHKHSKNIKEDIERGKFTSPPPPAYVHDARPTCIIPISVLQEVFIYYKTDFERNH